MRKLNYEKITTEKFLKEYKGENKSNTHISTCVRVLDELLGGLSKGKITSILGWTGTFKSTMALNISYAAQVQGLNTLYLSLEMSKYDVFANLLSRHSNQFKYKINIPHFDLKKKKLSNAALDYLEKQIIPDYEELPRKNLHSR